MNFGGTNAQFRGDVLALAFLLIPKAPLLETAVENLVVVELSLVSADVGGPADHTWITSATLVCAQGGDISARIDGSTSWQQGDRSE